MASRSVEELNRFGQDRLPGLIGMEILTCGPELATGRIPVTHPLIAGTGFLWAPVVIALADTLCAYGTGAGLPAGATSFTTVDLTANFLATVGEGSTIAGRATRLHGGRTTQVWDAVVTDEATGRTLAVFRCTQLILYPRT